MVQILAGIIGLVFIVSVIFSLAASGCMPCMMLIILVILVVRGLLGYPIDIEPDRPKSEPTVATTPKEEEEEEEKEFRTWTSASGKYTTEAAMIKASRLTITLEKTDGTVKEVKRLRLSEEDQKHIGRVCKDRKPRTWSSASGKYTTEAAMIKADPSSIMLEKTDGTVKEVKRSRLSQEDREYVDKACRWGVKIASR